MMFTRFRLRVLAASLLPALLVVGPPLTAAAQAGPTTVRVQLDETYPLTLTSRLPFATVGRPYTVTVTDTATGAPIAGADVWGQLTAADGTAHITFWFPGSVRLQAVLGAAQSNIYLVFIWQPW